MIPELVNGKARELEFIEENKRRRRDFKNIVHFLTHNYDRAFRVLRGERHTGAHGQVTSRKPNHAFLDESIRLGGRE